MSYPFHALKAGGNSRTVRTQAGLWGLDLVSSDFNRNGGSTKEMQNLIWQGDALGVRGGYELFWKIADQPIHGIYFYNDTPVIHAGTGLYGLVWTYPEDPYEEDQTPWRELKLLYDGMNPAPSHGVVRHQTVTKRYCTTTAIDAWRRETVTGDFLFLNDGKNYLVYDGEQVSSISDPYWGENVRLAVHNGARPVYWGTVPFTAVAKRPDSGKADVDPRGDNMLTQFRCESFYVDDEAEVTDFVLTCPFEAYNDDIPPEIQIRGDDGVWRSFAVSGRNDALRTGPYARLVIPGIRAGMAFSVDDLGVITNWGNGVQTVANDGMDNVRLTYAVFKEPPTQLTGATVQGFYGPTGGDDVLFLGGSDAAPGTDAFSAPNDFFCFYETSTEQLGNRKTPITGYCRLSDGRMAVLKQDFDGSTVFFRSHTTVKVGTTQAGESYTVDAYPSKAGAGVEGCLSSHSLGVVGNEPCFLAKTGLYSVRSVSNELTNLNETVRRSISIDPIFKTLDLQGVRSICWQGYYLLVFGHTALITDGRKDSTGSYRFLRWEFGHHITALGQWNGQLYLGDCQGNLYAWNNGADDAGLKIEAWWQLVLQEEGRGHRMILRRLWGAFSGAEDGTLTVQLTQDRRPTQGYTLSLAEAPAQWVDDQRWVSLVLQPRLAGTLVATIDFSDAQDTLFWGYRTIYEKGGLIS